MNTLYIMALEPIDTRYTGEWYTFLPKLFRDHIALSTKKYKVINIPGDTVSNNTTAGAFLNFSDTNIWKNTQINTIARAFAAGDIKPGDKFVFTDAWHPGIIQIRYMSDLLDIPVEIHSIWHAGSYDPNDFLGRKVKDKGWSYNFERSIFHASNKNYFATEYHARLFGKQLDLFDYDGLFSYPNKLVVTGFPFNYLQDIIPSKSQYGEKKNIILFPHRIAPEKQHNIFLDLAKSLPEYEFITCQDKKLTKHEYHDLLRKSKIVFSANLQETLGIGAYEGSLAGAIPLVPNRLSYAEMYPDMFKYPSIWTESWEGYLQNKDKLIILIRQFMENYDMYATYVYDLSKVINKFFNGNNLVNTIIQ